MIIITALIPVTIRFAREASLLKSGRISGSETGRRWVCSSFSSGVVGEASTTAVAVVHESGILLTKADSTPSPCSKELYSRSLDTI